MKTLIRFLFVAACFALFMTCEQADQVMDDTSGSELKSAQPITVTLPFKVDLIGTFTGFFAQGDQDFTCDPPFECRVLVDAEGTATHMGKITTHFDFCACGPDDPEIEAPDNQWGPANSVFVAANGDKLFVSCAGSVVFGRLPNHPEDVNSYWKDPFVITGGTGRFEGATGGGFTDDYNRDSYPENSFHHWTGTITLVKGKK